MIATLQWLSAHLPVVGIVAFSLSSVWSLYHLFIDSARHPSDLFWAPSVLVELVTAWLVYNSVQMTRRVTQSKISKQDRRFYAVMLALNLALMVPTLGVSVWANALEFQSWWLGSLFPVASIACAVAVAIPDAVKRRDNHREKERQEEAEKRKVQEREKLEAQAREQAEATRQQEFDNLVQSLGKAGETLRLYAANPMLSQAKAAQALGISRQAVGQHLAKLEQDGLISRNGEGVKIREEATHEEA